MNETPTYTHFDFQNEDDLSFGMFDVHSATNQPGFHQGIQPEAYGDTFVLHPQTAPPGHLSYQSQQFGFLPRNLIASYDEHTRSLGPCPAHPKFESPSLSSGSSSTPETNESRQFVTPKNASTLRHVTDEEGDADDIDDDHFPILSPARKKPGKRTAKENREPNEKEGKRRHFLQRNRVAAMKCRKKKKEWVNDLEETKTGLESQNTHLHMELDGLVDEASRIRAQLMVHANCNDSNIDKWIENEAKRFVIGTGERYDQILAHFSPTQGINNQQETMPSSEYAAAGGGGPNMGSPLATPSQLPPPTPHPSQVPPPSAFYAQNMPPMGTPGCYTIQSQEEASFAQGLDRKSADDDEPDYDGMPISLYSHSVS
ncbi:putative bZIP transcription factor [Rosellinia necatrix]|uniref:Putative bZIP transcription factor n=1 Tax=Rosellinia necatrix TaxID=77044 RepID=A0A1W2TSB7_ROSNE|nr:putative bZIP transcription factor [Rosellinia necatrix]